jgi:hypothetical protein
MFIYVFFYDVEWVQDFWRSDKRLDAAGTELWLPAYADYLPDNATKTTHVSQYKVSTKAKWTPHPPPPTPGVLNKNATEITVCKYDCTIALLSTHVNIALPFVCRYLQCSPHDDPKDIPSDRSTTCLQAYSGFSPTIWNLPILLLSRWR